MRSGELAKMAGVTVRALRHYHAIGLLEEPPRHANGYRDYGPKDLLRVLRIHQLASLGFPLEQVGGMLDELDAERGGAAASDPSRSPACGERPDGAGATHADALLDELDRALEERIASLREQRRLIARLRAGALEADFPERAAGALAAIRRLNECTGGAGMLLALDSDSDRLAMGIAAHLDDEVELAEIERVFNAIVDRGLVGEYRAASELVDGLPADASDGERAAAVDACLVLLDRISDCFDAANWLREDKDYELLMESASRGAFNAAQLAVSDEVCERLAARIAERASAAAVE